MQVISYLGFTLLSVVMQFAVIGFIQTKQKLEITNKTIDLNITSPKKRFHDLLKDLSDKPHALFYRTKMNAIIDKNNITTNITTNTSLTDISMKTTTDLSTTIIDIFYDENISTSTLGDHFTSTESLFTTTELEYDNVTEITFFQKKNETVSKPKVTPKKTIFNISCDCNLLYKVCDINCCCDGDCTEIQMKMFSCFGSPKKRSDDMFCDAQHTLTSYLIGSSANNLFCIAKTNLPERRIVNLNKKHDPSTVSKSFKWHANTRERTVMKFEKEIYKYGDPIWVLRNGSVFYMDFPATFTNNYCTERKPIQFLRDQKITCNVKLTDLEIFQILGSPNNASVISVTEKSLNSSVWNCTTLHCTNWTIQVCEDSGCVKYDKDVHEPACSERICTHLALSVDYLFHYYDSKIMNVTIRLRTQNISLSINTPFFTQQVNVIFILVNESSDEIISLSGNPGYISGLPVIISRAEWNYSDNFYNKTSKLIRHLPYPDNHQGMCVTNVDTRYVLFGVNKRFKCRHVHHNNVLINATDVCRNIQNELALLFTLKKKIMASPLGNPHGLKDEDWLTMSYTFDDDKQIFGEINNQKLLCYNLIARVSFVFTYVDISEVVEKRVNKILSAKIEATEKNVTFNVEDISLVATLDVMFIDESQPTVYEYAAAPQLNIHLPRDFFFPFPNSSSVIKCNVCVILCAFVLLLITITK